MKERLQKLDYKRSPYVRVTQNWVCGRAREGRACQVGPTTNGRCQARFECRPAKNAEGRWQCTRSEFCGGRCEQGPLPDGTCCNAILPCQPQRTMRSKRRMATRWAVMFSIGLLALVMGGGATAVFSPGDLSFGHGKLVGDCGACHTGAEGGPAGWLHAAFVGEGAQADTGLCLGCHSLGTEPQSPHNQSPTRLAALTQEAESRAAGGTAPFKPLLGFARTATAGMSARTGAEPGCTSCHSEHDGQLANLSVISNDECMVCHVETFESFADGHPQFSPYPYGRRSALAFDHVSHIGKHFHSSDFADMAPRQCSSCHEPATDGTAMVVSGFEETCADCHAEQIRGVGRASAKGIAVLNVPGLDVITLKEEAIGVGVWPEFADGDPTPFMALLLSTDPDYRAARATVEELDRLDLRDASAEELEAVARWAWSVKGLYFDLATEGTAALRTRLETALGTKLSTDDVARLSALLPVDALRGAHEEWFPGLLAEVARYRRTGAFPPVEQPEEEAPGADTADDPAPDDSGDGMIDTGEIDTGDDGGILGDLGGDEDTGDDGGILGDLGGDEDTGDDGGILGDLGGDADTGDDGGILGDLGGDTAPDAAPTGDVHAEPLEEIEIPEPAEGEDWASAGGWYRQFYTLAYRPVGHADTFLRAWVDQTAHAVGTEGPDGAAAPASRLFDHLMSKESPGLCVKCHSVDQSADKSGVTVNWTGHRPDQMAKPFTEFSHAAHFNQLDQDGCLTCHAIDREAPFMAGFDDRDPSAFASNFKPMQQEVCAECHTETGAGASCISCHNYHVGEFPPAKVASPDMKEGM